MKKIFVLLAVCLVSLTGCEKSTEEGDNSSIVVPSGSNLSQAVYADEVGGNDGVSFSTKAAWSSSISESVAQRSGSSKPDWISISPDKGDAAGDYTINITLLKNYDGADRSATITITCAGTSIDITVTQKATTEEGEVLEAPRLLAKITEDVNFESDINNSTNNFDYEQYYYEFAYDEQYRLKEYHTRYANGDIYEEYIFDYASSGKVTVDFERHYSDIYTHIFETEVNNKGNVRLLYDEKEGDVNYTYDSDGYLIRSDEDDRIDFNWTNGNMVSMTADRDYHGSPLYLYNYSGGLNNKTTIDLNSFFFGKGLYRPHLYEEPYNDIIDVLSIAGVMGKRDKNYAVSAQRYSRENIGDWPAGIFNELNAPSAGDLANTKWEREFYGDGTYAFDEEGYPVSFTHKVKVAKTEYIYNGERVYLPVDQQTPEAKFWVKTDPVTPVVSYDTYTYTMTYKK